MRNCSWRFGLTLKSIAAFLHGWLIAIEWPKTCAYWKRKKVKALLALLGLQRIEILGCMLGLTASDGLPIKKPWYSATNCLELISMLKGKVCKGHHERHTPCQGSETKRTEQYTPELARIVHDAFRRSIASNSSVLGVPIRLGQEAEDSSSSEESGDSGSSRSSGRSSAAGFLAYATFAGGWEPSRYNSNSQEPKRSLGSMNLALPQPDEEMFSDGDLKKINPAARKHIIMGWQGYLQECCFALAKVYDSETYKAMRQGDSLKDWSDLYKALLQRAEVWNASFFHPIDLEIVLHDPEAPDPRQTLKDLAEKYGRTQKEIFELLRESPPRLPQAYMQSLNYALVGDSSINFSNAKGTSGHQAELWNKVNCTKPANPGLRRWNVWRMDPRGALQD